MPAHSRPSTSWWWAAARPAPPRRTTWPARAARVLLLDKAGRIKPCGGAIPPRLIRDFDIPDHMHRRPGQCRAHDRAVRPRGGHADRRRLRRHGRPRAFRRIPARPRRRGRRRTPHRQLRADRRAMPTASPSSNTRHKGGDLMAPRPRRAARDRRRRRAQSGWRSRQCRARTRCPASSPTTRSSRPRSTRRRQIRRASAATCSTRASISPDFYAWIFPHGDNRQHRHRLGAEGLLAARLGRPSCASATGLDKARHHPPRRRADPAEAAAKRWDNGRDVVLAGDAAGVVAPASGEGIYYAMLGGRLAAEAAEAFCHRQARGARPGPQALHEGAWPGLLGARDHAVFLVLVGQAPREVRRDLPGQGRPAPDLGEPT